MSRNSDNSYVTAKDFVRFSIGMFNMISRIQNNNFETLVRIFEDHGFEKDINLQELKEIEKEAIDLECYLGQPGTDYWTGVIKDLIQKVFREYSGTICSSSPVKNKLTKEHLAQANTITEPTISSIRKAKLGITGNTDSSLSSRSISKDKKSTPLNARLKLASRNNKSKAPHLDYTSIGGGSITKSQNQNDSMSKDKKYLLGKKVRPSNSQKSLNEENINYDKSKGVLRTPVANKSENK